MNNHSEIVQNYMLKSTENFIEILVAYDPWGMYNAIKTIWSSYNFRYIEPNFIDTGVAMLDMRRFIEKRVTESGKNGGEVLQMLSQKAEQHPDRDEYVTKIVLQKQ